MAGHKSLAVNFNEEESKMRPRAYSEPAAKRPDMSKKKIQTFQLPQIYIEEAEEFDNFEPMPRQRAYTSPDEMFRQKRHLRPGTPPPADDVPRMGKKHASLEKIGVQPHKLCRVPEN